MGPGTHRLGARQQQRPSGSHCQIDWMHAISESTLCMLGSIIMSSTSRQGGIWLCMKFFCRRSTIQHRALSQLFTRRCSVCSDRTFDVQAKVLTLTASS